MVVPVHERGTSTDSFLSVIGCFLTNSFTLSDIRSSTPTSTHLRLRQMGMVLRYMIVLDYLAAPKQWLSTNSKAKLEDLSPAICSRQFTAGIYIHISSSLFTQKCSDCNCYQEQYTRIRSSKVRIITVTYIAYMLTVIHRPRRNMEDNNYSECVSSLHIWTFVCTSS